MQEWCAISDFSAAGNLVDLRRAGQVAMLREVARLMAVDDALLEPELPSLGPIPGRTEVGIESCTYYH